jgi:hypothetical protein
MDAIGLLCFSRYVPTLVVALLGQPATASQVSAVKVPEPPNQQLPRHRRQRHATKAVRKYQLGFSIKPNESKHCINNGVDVNRLGAAL